MIAMYRKINVRVSRAVIAQLYTDVNKLRVLQRHPCVTKSGGEKFQ